MHIPYHKASQSLKSNGCLGVTSYPLSHFPGVEMTVFLFSTFGYLYPGMFLNELI